MTQESILSINFTREARENLPDPIHWMLKGELTILHDGEQQRAEMSTPLPKDTSLLEFGVLCGSLISELLEIATKDEDEE